MESSPSGPKRNRLSDINRSARRRQQREREREQARVSLDSRQRARDLAQKLLFLSEEYTEFREYLTSLANRVNVAGAAAPDRHGVLVMEAIEQNFCRYDWEIAEDTSLQLSDVRNVLRAYVAAGRLKEVDIESEMQYVPTGTERSSMVLP